MGATSRERYAVVSCHVERPLDDAVWAHFSALQRRCPGGFRVAALMRPADLAFGEDESAWLERAGEAATHGPLGHHTHWTAPDHARPTSGAPGERVLAEGARLRELGLAPTAVLRRRLVRRRRGRGGVCGARVRRLHATRRSAALPSARRALGLADRTLRPRVAVGKDAGRDSDDALARRSRSCPPSSRAPDLVHVYFHDTDLLDRRRRALLGLVLRLLARRARVSDLDALAARTLSGSASRRVGRRGAALTSTGCPARSLRRRRPHALRRHLRERVVTFAPRASTSSRAGRSSSVVRRVLSVAALVALDIAGLALGIYLALVVRELVTGNGDVLWSLLWREGPAEWLKFAAPITVLVFAQAGLYRRRELRPGAGRILACLIVVALIVLAFGIGTGYDFSTSGLIPTSVILSAVTIGLLRAAYESAALEVMRAAGIRRRVVLVGAGESLVRLRASLESARSGLSYEFVGVVAPDAVPGFRLLGGHAELPGRPRPGSAGRGDPHRGRLRRAHGLRGRRAGAQAGHQGAARTRHDRAARAARGVRAGPGRTAVRAAPARPDRLGLGGEARIRPRRRACSSS